MERPQNPGRVAVIGDLGGHSHQLRRVLTRLGVTFDGATADDRPSGHDWASVELGWPDDLHVVSVGDLVHRGPDSLGVLVLIDRLLERGHWTQVAGNHEQLYVDRPVFGWHETIDDAGIDLLRAWWADGRMTTAAALESDDGDHLVTHAGLTHGFWDRALDRPGTAAAAAAGIHAETETGMVWRPGSMLGYQRDLCAGPVWAEAGPELLLSWALAADHHPLPFHQVHGHSSVYAWDDRAWRCPDLVRDRVSLDPGRRHATATFGGCRIVGIDPGHGTHAAPVFAPLLLTGARVLDPAGDPAGA